MKEKLFKGEAIYNRGTGFEWFSFKFLSFTENKKSVSFILVDEKGKKPYHRTIPKNQISDETLSLLRKLKEKKGK